MNKDKVYLKGYVIGHAADTLGYEGLLVQLENLDVVEIDKNLVHRDINEPQKKVVPQFVADYIKYAKDSNWDLIDAMKGISYEDYDDLMKWFYKDNNQETFALAWINGYAVEKEKRYLVKIKGIEEDINYLNYDYSESGWYFADDENGPVVGTHHTRDELENAGFGWVFDCEGIEIEEVE